MPKPNPPKTKAGKLNKKIGPLPLKVWLGILAGVLLLLFLYMRGKKSGGTSVEGESVPLNPYSTVTPQQAASAGTPSPNSSVESQLSPDVLSALGIGMPTDYVTSTDLQSQIDSLGSNVAAQIANATFNPSPSVTTATTKEPGKVAPVTKTAHAAPVKKSVPAAKKAPVRYFTYAPGKAPKGKKGSEIVPIKGKKIQFKKGSGYYYA